MSAAALEQSSFPKLLQAFFCERLINQQNVSPRTVASYRDAFRLILSFAQEQTGKAPVALSLADLDAPLVLAFLDHLEKARRNTIRSRNLRLAALRAFLSYAALREPTALPTIQRVLAIPFKRFAQNETEHLSREEIEAILGAPATSSWSGCRDRVMLETFYNTGARVSEIVGLAVGDVSLGRAASLVIQGKGRKQRTVPLWKRTATHLRDWLRRIPADPTTPLFPNRCGTRLTRSGVEMRLRLAITSATQRCPSLRRRRISPHTLRHTTAMHLLQSGVDIAVIALWLGHESITTTHRYMEADLALKRRALSKLHGPATSRLRFQPTDRLLEFLERL